VRRKIIDLLSLHPEGLTRKRLFEMVYADDIDGGPDNMNVISVLVRHANRELWPQGWKIVTTIGRGALYKLVKTDGNPKLQPARSAYARAMEGLEPAVTPRQHR
jgi:hypothetical protein